MALAPICALRYKNEKTEYGFDPMTNFSAAAFPHARPRRLRASAAMRDLVRETMLCPADLIWPIFVVEGQEQRQPIRSMPDVCRYSVDQLGALAKRAQALGIRAVCVFPQIDAAHKSENCSEAWNPNNLSNRAIAELKSAAPDLLVMGDVALDPYNSKGHDGIVQGDKILNDETVAALVKMSLAQAKAGADILGPSDMMDGRIHAIRSALEQDNHKDVILLSYAAKFASGFYGPFRDAVGTAGALSGSKDTYQIDPANGDEALRMISRDIKEGADMVMIKPGMPYLDICRRARDTFNVPVFAYQVSGEYAMLQAATQNGWLDGAQVMRESLLAFKRAGCSGILTYFAPFFAENL